MPVGNSDQGVGLSAGDIMISSDMFYQFIDWRHDQIDDSEPYDHEGTLSTTIISPKVTIGLSDWWNLSFQQILGTRHMGWYIDGASKHHRDEGSESNFDNAIGGYLGDSRFMIRYLLLNAGKPLIRRYLIKIYGKEVVSLHCYFRLETIHSLYHYRFGYSVYRFVDWYKPRAGRRHCGDLDKKLSEFSFFAFEKRRGDRSRCG